jgi:hypothetical protein
LLSRPRCPQPACAAHHLIMIIILLLLIITIARPPFTAFLAMSLMHASLLMIYAVAHYSAPVTPHVTTSYFTAPCVSPNITPYATRPYVTPNVTSYVTPYHHALLYVTVCHHTLGTAIYHTLCHTLCHPTIWYTLCHHKRSGRGTFIRGRTLDLKCTHVPSSCLRPGWACVPGRLPGNFSFLRRFPVPC